MNFCKSIKEKKNSSYTMLMFYKYLVKTWLIENLIDNLMVLYPIALWYLVSKVFEMELIGFIRPIK